MKSALIVLSLVVLVLTGHAQAQEPSGRIDLDVVSGAPGAGIVIIRVGFVENDRDCPTDSQQKLRIRNATLTRLEIRMPSDQRPSSHWQETQRPRDDETQLYQIATQTCRTEIAIREQVRRDGAWISSLVLASERQGVSSDARRELLRQSLEDLRARAQTPEGRALTDRLTVAANAVRMAGSLTRANGSIVTFPFAFADKPQECFEAIGDYRIERFAVMFSFMTGLPGDLNRFMIERADPDPYHGRIFFTRGDCRFELTISQSVLQEGGELGVPLAPIPASKG
jgi:hypothetical protein